MAGLNPMACEWTPPEVPMCFTTDTEGKVIAFFDNGKSRQVTPDEAAEYYEYIESFKNKNEDDDNIDEICDLINEEEEMNEWFHTQSTRLAKKPMSEVPCNKGVKCSNHRCGFMHPLQTAVSKSAQEEPKAKK